MSPPAVVVLAKSPAPGRVKTRCCPPCSPVQAAELAAAALADTLDAVVASWAPRRILALDGAPGPWLPAGVELVAQCDGDLGRRIDHAIATAGGPALLIGMDTPQVSTDRLDRALRVVTDREAGAVVGPARDGGFWALGVAAPLPDLCAAVPMSTPTTAARLSDELDRRHVEWRELDELVDVDDIEAAAHVAASMPGSRFGHAFAAVSAALRVAP